MGDLEIIRGEFDALIGVDEYDVIVIETVDGSVKWRCAGVNGDSGTVSVMLSFGERMWWHSPGLLTMVDILPFRVRFKL